MLYPRGKRPWSSPLWCLLLARLLGLGQEGEGRQMLELVSKGKGSSLSTTLRRGWRGGDGSTTWGAILRL
jgi:hypothetical protein